MKDGKKTAQKNNAPKKKETVNKKPKDFEKEVNVSEPPRVTKIESPVRETKKVNIDDDFIDEDGDKKLVVVITIAILVIVATIIGLLVGCERQEEPENPLDDEIVVPVEDDEEDEKEVEKVVVQLSTTKAQKTEKEEEKVEEVKIPSYNVIYYFDEKTHHESVKEGDAASEYVPTGYNTCSYFKDADYLEEYTFENVYEDTNVYMMCNLTEYTVVYEEGYTHDNPTTFTVNSNVELKAPETDEIFVGWYLDNEGTKEVTTLDKKLVKEADTDNTVYLYAKTVTTVNVQLLVDEEVLYNEDLDKLATEGYQLPAASTYENVCGNSSFLGWTESKGTNNIDYKDKSALELNRDYVLYAVCGDATIVYTSNGETVTVAYTTEQLAQEGFELPKPSTMEGMETPVYFVPVDEATLTSKKVVSDDEVELGENEVYLSDVTNNTKGEYAPTVGDYVEEYEKVFKGWKEKTEEVQEETDPEEGTETEEGMEPENGTEVVEDEIVTEEDVKQMIEESTETPAEVELEAVWEIPEDETEEGDETEPTPEVGEGTPEEEVQTPSGEETPGNAEVASLDAPEVLPLA